MEEQLAALGLGLGARVIECLRDAGRPLLWKELYAALEEELGSRGTLTKTLTRLANTNLVVRKGGRYSLTHEAEITAVLRAATALEVAIAEARLGAARK